MMAGSDTFRITIHAPGGHAAHPHKTPDPVAAAAYMITQLQTIVSRETAPLDSAVVTVGKMTAGTAANIIPSEVVLEGSLRYLLPETRAKIHESIRRIAAGTALSLRVEASVEILPGCGPVIGEDRLVDMIETAVTRLLGPEKADVLPTASMGSEDFAFYLEKKPARSSASAPARTTRRAGSPCTTAASISAKTPSPPAPSPSAASPSSPPARTFPC